jgi:hypothetical protein
MIELAIRSLLGDEGGSLVAQLTVELVPESCDRVRLADELAANDWRQLAALVLERAARRCEVCGRRVAEPDLACEERWSYDDRAHVRRLDRLIAMCSACREVAHIDLAARLGTADRALLHLATINGWNDATAERHVVEAYELWEKRRVHSWRTDLARLRSYGIELPPLPLRRLGQTGAAGAPTRRTPTD